MAAVAAPPPHSMSAVPDMMDTRTPSPVQRNGSIDTPATDDYKPDLSAEVAMLSTKLVNAINYQTNLDDSLQHTRHELDQMRKELERARAQKKEMDDMIANGALVRKAHVDKTINQLRADLGAARSAREGAEMSKKQTEGELENLTVSLFEEANTMVAAARKDTEAVERRNSQLRGQLGDTEVLLASQTEQLQDLKGVVERLERQSEYDGRDLSVPVTPVDARTAAWDALQLSPSTGLSSDVAPDHPLHFSQLLAPILRTDIASYTDFQELLFLARRASPHSRQGSNSTNALSSASQTNLHSSTGNASSPNLPGSFFSTSANNSPSSSTFGNQPVLPPLKDSKFYKRTLAEDIEPALRLDLAPGLSFLSRRSVLSSLLNGSLVVEPFNASFKHYGFGAVFACALCGEQRKKEPYVRKHRFRTSEDDGAQRYPLCDYCLGRIRAAGDFVGFLRMLRDGHWRCESETDEKNAWEEATRLRERMFWARLGGGVVPASQLMRREAQIDSPESVRAIKSARQSLESIPERSAREIVEAAASEGMDIRDVTPAPPQIDREVSQPVPQIQRDRSPSGIARAIVGASSGVLATGRPDATPQPTQMEEVQAQPEAEPQQQPQTPEAVTPSIEEATTPFEDALSGSKELQADADAQLQREARASEAETDEELPAKPEIPTVHEPTPEPEAETTAPPPVERRPSGVLARVRAMEAAASAPPPQKKVPGAFE